MKTEEKDKLKVIVRNRKARHEYFLTETFEAGLRLTGTEVKSLRDGKVSLQEAYCAWKDDGFYVLGMNIAEYDKGSYNNHEPRRERKLLLTKKEIRKLRRRIDEKGMTLVPLEMYFSARNLAKLEIGLAKGKKSYDKRDSIKDKDTKRDVARQMKDY